MRKTNDFKRLARVKISGFGGYFENRRMLKEKKQQDRMKLSGCVSDGLAGAA